jgi:hypothetical protein
VTYVYGTNKGAELRILLCIEFDRRATPAAVASLKSVLVDSPNCIHSIDVTGAFDLIAEFSAPGIGWYKSWLAGLAEPFARVVNRYEANFVFGRAVRRTMDEEAVWVPENGGFKRIDSALIDKVTAEGDYVRIHSRGESWMLHDTMKSVSRRLPPSDFIRSHRSTIVRFRFIRRVARELGHWVAHLADGTSEPVARSHVVETLEVVRSHATTASLPRVHAPIRGELEPLRQ